MAGLTGRGLESCLQSGMESPRHRPNCVFRCVLPTGRRGKGLWETKGPQKGATHLSRPAGAYGLVFALRFHAQLGCDERGEFVCRRTFHSA